MDGFGGLGETRPTLPLPSGYFRNMRFGSADRDRECRALSYR